MRRHDRLIKKAIGVAKTSKQRWSHGAVIAVGNKIISCAPNRFRNPSSIDYVHATVHAEVAAIKGSERQGRKLQESNRVCRSNRG